MNDIEKVIENIQEQFKIGIDFSNGKDMTVICIYDKQAGIVLEALEKQMPKKPTINSFQDIMRMKYVYRVSCPKCNDNITIIEFINEKEKVFKNNENYKYCCECGQKLNWEVE